MGLGKTAAVLAWLAWYNRKHANGLRGLIIAPKRVAENNWLQEAQKWGLDELADRMIICSGTPQKRAKALADDTRSIKIISRDNFKDYANTRTDFLIIDELTTYKNPTAARTKAVCSIAAPIKIGLTGTFLANGAIDIFAQAQAVGVGWGLSFSAWRGVETGSLSKKEKAQWQDLTAQAATTPSGAQRATIHSTVTLVTTSYTAMQATIC